MTIPGQLWSPSEEDFDRLLGQESQRAAAETTERLAVEKGFTSDDLTLLRRFAKSDLFFLCTVILGYDLLSPRFHQHFCTWMERTRSERYRLILLPRGHYKSTISTIADSIQIALPNDVGVTTYPHRLGPNVKLLLAHENRESASRFLYEIAAAFTRNPMMRLLFPELIPRHNVQRFNKWELDLPRDHDSREPTFDTIGVSGAAQGRHYNHAKLDDLVGEEARTSVLVMDRTNFWLDNVQSLLTRPRFDGWDLTGTRWSDSDTYGHALKKFGMRRKGSHVTVYSQGELDRLHDGRLVTYARPAIENSEPIFPEEFPLADLEEIRKNPVIWAAQYANNPRESGLTEFKPSWLKFYNVAERGTVVIFTGGETLRIDPRDLDVVVFVDPSMGESDRSDESGVTVSGTDKTGKIIILEAWKKRLRPPELVDTLFQLNTKFYPRIFSIESVAFSAIYKYWMEEKARQLRISLRVRPYKPGSKRSKEARVRGLTNYFAAGQVYILPGMHQLRDEYEAFPLDLKNMHILDSLAQGPEVWKLAGFSRPDSMPSVSSPEDWCGNKYRSVATGY